MPLRTIYTQYDSIGQLIAAKRGGLHEVFEYDVTGSLQNVLGDLGQVGRVRPWDMHPGNVLTATPEARYENDLRGRRTRKATKPPGSGSGQGPRVGEEITDYSWDTRDRLREVKLPDGRRVRFTYDAFARRVRKEVIPAERADFAGMVKLALVAGKDALPKSRVVEFLWDGDVLAREIESGAEKKARVFVHHPGTFVPMLQAEDGAVFTYVNDHLGMPKELVDQDGRVAWAGSHSAWGRVAETWRDPRAKRGVETPFRLLGQYADEETGLCYTRFRYFDAGTGRWCSPDPLGIGGGKNLLGFDGSVTFAVDPLGLACDDPAGPDNVPVLAVPAGSPNIGRDMNRQAIPHLLSARAAGASAAEMGDMYEGMAGQIKTAAEANGQQWGASRLDCSDGSQAFAGEGGGRELVITPDRSIHVGPPGLINMVPTAPFMNRNVSPLRLVVAPPNIPGPAGTNVL